MDIKNIALVRATNILPVDGVVRPVSETPYIKKDMTTPFAMRLTDLLKKVGLVKMPANFFMMSDEEQEEFLKQKEEIYREYLPYNSDYNPVVLWSLNGIVPDDINNTFSNKDIAIIESLEEQVNKGSTPVSIMPTDTAIKGNVELSDRATILIRKERYDSLTDEEKESLRNLGATKVLFEGDLGEKVGVILDREEDYPKETLTLHREDKGFEESETKEELLDAIEKVSEEHGIPQVLYFDLVTGQNDHKEELKSVNDIFKNSTIVSECYNKTFLNYLFSKLDISEEVQVNALSFMNSEVYMQDVANEIERIGLEKYKEVVTSFNQTIEELKEEGLLPTPEEIVESLKEDKDYTLNDLINEYEDKDKSKTKEIVEEQLEEKIGDTKKPDLDDDEGR